MLVHEWITVAYGGNWEDAGRKKPRLSELLITAATATFITHPADAASAIQEQYRSEAPPIGPLSRRLRATRSLKNAK
jgi:hypothetical protein